MLNQRRACEREERLAVRGPVHASNTLSQLQLRHGMPVPAGHLHVHLREGLSYEPGPGSDRTVLTKPLGMEEA